MADFRKLRVWADAHALGVEAHRIADEMRNSRTRDMCGQLARAAKSISANIAEGSGHESPREYARYLQYSMASISETEEHVRMARDINAMPYNDFKDLIKRIVSVRRQLQRFIEKIRERIPPSRKPKAKRRPDPRRKRKPKQP